MAIFTYLNMYTYIYTKFKVFDFKVFFLLRKKQGHIANYVNYELHAAICFIP